MMCKLSDICEFVKGKVAVSNLTKTNYISTENMLPNRGGIVEAATLPSVDTTQTYTNGDILVSNIRPYFKKIWFATTSGGCSNDVLVFRAKKDVNPSCLYYILSDDRFFNYATATSKGTKMPRGDKIAIMNYEIEKHTRSEQDAIASILRPIDEKISLNREINNNLEEQLKALFAKMFGKQIDDLSDSSVKLGDLITSIDNRGKTPPLVEESTEYPIIDVKALSGDTRIIDYSNCTKYVAQSTYDTWFRSGHPQQYDILISTVGSLASMKVFLGNKGCIAQNVVGFRSKSVSPLYLYQYLNYIKADLLAYDIGSVQPSIKVTHIIKHPVFVPCKSAIDEFDSIARSVTESLFVNSNEIRKLTSIRDAILPRLMSGEVDVSAIEI